MGRFHSTNMTFAALRVLGREQGLSVKTSLQYKAAVDAVASLRVLLDSGCSKVKENDSRQWVESHMDEVSVLLNRAIPDGASVHFAHEVEVMSCVKAVATSPNNEDHLNLDKPLLQMDGTTSHELNPHAPSFSPVNTGDVEISTVVCPTIVCLERSLPNAAMFDLKFELETESDLDECSSCCLLDERTKELDEIDHAIALALGECSVHCFSGNDARDCRLGRQYANTCNL